MVYRTKVPEVLDIAKINRSWEVQLMHYENFRKKLRLIYLSKEPVIEGIKGILETFKLEDSWWYDKYPSVAWRNAGYKNNYYPVYWLVDSKTGKLFVNKIDGKTYVIMHYNSYDEWINVMDIPWNPEFTLNCEEWGVINGAKVSRTDNNNWEITWKGQTYSSESGNISQNLQYYPLVEYVDLGLPSGTLWAKWNVGATSETDTGLYFAWGDTQGYTADQVGTGEGLKAFSWSDYIWTNDGGTTFIKYNSTPTVLELDDDAAHVNMGGEWHMPTDLQFKELLDNTDNKWTMVSNTNGYKFASKTDSSKYIFIPAVGRADNGSVELVGDAGCVLSNSLMVGHADISQYLIARDRGARVAGNSRYFGYPVRGVIGNIPK